MKDIFSSAVVWFIIGLVCFLLEFVLPGFILFFFGIGAWIVAVLSLFIEVSINVQILLFLISSILTVVLFRKWVKTKLGMYKSGPEVLEDEFIGKTARATSIIGPTRTGKVEFKGTSWDASSEDTIAEGEQVIITDRRSIQLIVKSIQSL